MQPLLGIGTQIQVGKRDFEVTQITKDSVTFTDRDNPHKTPLTVELKTVELMLDRREKE